MSKWTKYRLPVTPKEERVDRDEALTHCPRCGEILRTAWQEPDCLICGFVDYSAPLREHVIARGVILNTGHLLARYVGEGDAYKETLLRVKFGLKSDEGKSKERLYPLHCPMCGGRRVDPASLSGRRKEHFEERFVCAEGHRFSLVPKGEFCGWK